MKRKTKAELEIENTLLREQLLTEQLIGKGHSITGCHIDMSEDRTMETDIAIARAVEEGMKALQQIKLQPKYGMYFEAPGKPENEEGES